MKFGIRVKRRPLVKPAHASGIVKTALLFIAFATLVLATEKSELNRKSTFDSVDGFVTAMKAFQPAASKSV